MNADRGYFTGGVHVSLHLPVSDFQICVRAPTLCGKRLITVVEIAYVLYHLVVQTASASKVRGGVLCHAALNVERPHVSASLPYPCRLTNRCSRSRASSIFS